MTTAVKAINTSDPTENAVARIESSMLSCKLLEIVFATYICAQENTKNARIAGIGVAASTTADTMSTRDRNVAGTWMQPQHTQTTADDRAILVNTRPANCHQTPVWWPISSCQNVSTDNVPRLNTTIFHISGFRSSTAAAATVCLT